jgi:hypothetical protein
MSVCMQQVAKTTRLQIRQRGMRDHASTGAVLVHLDTVEQAVCVPHRLYSSQVHHAEKARRAHKLKSWVSRQQPDTGELAIWYLHEARAPHQNNQLTVC